MADDDVMECCPYDRSHQFLRTRMPYHILRCARNYPNVKLKHCPYDRRHFLNSKDYDNHIMSCPSKLFTVNTAITSVDSSTDETPGIIPVQPFVVRDPPIEAWGVDDVSPSPLQSIIHANSKTQQFSTPLIGGSKNQRKKHRLMLRRIASEQDKASGHNGEDNLKQKKHENSQPDTSDASDPNKKPAVAQSVLNTSSPSVKAEDEVLKISELKINTQKNTAATESQKSRPNVCTFSYAAALSSKNKLHRQV